MESVKMPTHVRFLVNCFHGDKGEVVEIEQIDLNTGISTVRSAWASLKGVEFLHCPKTAKKILDNSDDEEEYDEEEVDRWNEGLL